jgi:hypothetical protein
MDVATIADLDDGDDQLVIDDLVRLPPRFMSRRRSSKARAIRGYV